jgi:hypothetical protein
MTARQKLQLWRSGRAGRAVQEHLRRKYNRLAPKIRCASQPHHDGGPKQLFAHIYAPLAQYRDYPLQGTWKERQGIIKQETYYKQAWRRNFGCNKDDHLDLQNNDMAVDRQSRRRFRFYLRWLQVLKVHVDKRLAGLLDNKVQSKCRGHCLVCCRPLSTTPPHLISLSAQHHGFFPGPFPRTKS